MNGVQKLFDLVCEAIDLAVLLWEGLRGSFVSQSRDHTAVLLLFSVLLPSI